MRQHIQVVFQNSTASLNQRLPVWRSIMEPLDIFPNVQPPFLEGVRHSAGKPAAKPLDIDGLQAAHMDRYPYELSGGQRVAIAFGSSLKPRLLICDEPTYSRDVSVQAQS